MVKLRNSHKTLRIILFCVLGAIVAAAGVAAIVIFTGSTHSPDEPTVTVNTKTEVPDGLTPAEAAQSSSKSANTLYYLAYTLDAQDSYSVTAVNSSSSMGIKSTTRTYKDYADGVMVATDITSGITKSAVQTCYVLDDNGTMVAYKRTGSGASSSATVSSISWNETYSDTYYYYRDNYLTIYGEFSTEMTVYLINDETIESYSAITDNGDGTYSQTFVFNDKAAWWYQYAMKTNGGLDDYPEFDKIEMTVTFDESWRVTQIVVEEDTVVEMVGTFSTSATTTTTFSYGESAIDSTNYSYYASYFTEAMPYATAGGDAAITTAETSALTVLQAAFSDALNGGDQFFVTLDMGGQTYYGYLYLNININSSDILNDLDIRLTLSADETCDSQDLYVELKNGDVNAYYSSNFALTADIDEVSSVISQFTEWVNNYSYGTSGTSVQAAKTKLTSDGADSSFDLGELLGNIEMTDNNNGTVSITLALDDLYGIDAYVQIDVTVTESTDSSGTTTKAYAFKSAYIGDLSYNGEDVELEINLKPTEAAEITREASQTPFDLAEAISSVYAILNSRSIMVDLSLEGDKIASLLNSVLSDTEYSDYIALLSDYEVIASAIVNIKGITTQANVKIRSDSLTVIDMDICYAYDGSAAYGIAYISINNIMDVDCTVKAYCNIADLADGISDIIALAESMTGTDIDDSADSGESGAAESNETGGTEEDDTSAMIVAIINAVLGLDFSNSLTVTAQDKTISATLNVDNLINDIVAAILGTDLITFDIGAGELTLNYEYSTDESGNVLAGVLSLGTNSMGILFGISGCEDAVTVPDDADTYLDLTGAVNSVYELLASDTLQLDLTVNGSAIVGLVNGLTGSDYSDYLSILNDYDITIYALVDADGAAYAKVKIASASVTVIDADIYYLFDGIYSGTSEYGTVYLSVNAFMNAQCAVKIYCGIDDIADSVYYIQYMVTGEEQEDEQGDDGSSLSVLDIVEAVLAVNYTKIINEITIDSADGVKVSVDADEIIALFLEGITLNLGDVELDYSYTTDGSGNAQAGELNLTAVTGISVTLAASPSGISEPADDYLSLNNLMTSVENAVKVAMDIAESGASFGISGAVNVNGVEISVDGSGEVVLETSTIINADEEEVTTTALKSAAVDVTLEVANGIYGSESNASKVSLQVVYLADNFKAAEEGEEEVPFLYIVIDGKGIAVTYSQYDSFVAEMASVYEVISGLLGTDGGSVSVISETDGLDSDGSSSVSISDEDILAILDAITGLFADVDILANIGSIADVLNNFAVTADESGAISLTYSDSDGENQLTLNIAKITTADGKLALASDIAQLSAYISAYDGTTDLAGDLVEAFADNEIYDLSYDVSGMAAMLYGYVFDCIDNIDLSAIFGSDAYELAFVLDGDASGISSLEGVNVNVTATAGVTSDSKNIYTLDADMDIGGFTVDISMVYYSGYIYININDIGGTQFTDLSVKASADDIYSLAENVVELIFSEDVLSLVSSLVPADDGDGTEDTGTEDNAAAEAVLIALTSDGEVQEETSSTLTAVIEMLASLADGTLITIDTGSDRLVLIDIDGILSPFGITAGAGTFTVDNIYTDDVVTGVRAQMTAEGASDAWLAITANGTSAARYTAVSATEEGAGTFYTGDYVDIGFVSQLAEDIAKFAVSGVQTDNSSITGVEYTFTGSIDVSAVSLVNVSLSDIVLTAGYGSEGIYLNMTAYLSANTFFSDNYIGITYYNNLLTLARGVDDSDSAIYYVMTFDYFIDYMFSSDTSGYDSPIRWLTECSDTNWSILLLALDAAMDLDSISSGLKETSEIFLYEVSQQTSAGAVISIFSDYITSFAAVFSDSTYSYGDYSSAETQLGLSLDTYTDGYYVFDIASSLTGGTLTTLYAAITRDADNGLGSILAYAAIDSYVTISVNLAYAPATTASDNYYINATESITDGSAVDGVAHNEANVPATGESYIFGGAKIASGSVTYLDSLTLADVYYYVYDEDDTIIAEGVAKYGSTVYTYSLTEPVYAENGEYIVAYSTERDGLAAESYVLDESICEYNSDDNTWSVNFYKVELPVYNVKVNYLLSSSDGSATYNETYVILQGNAFGATLAYDGYTLVNVYTDEKCTEVYEYTTAALTADITLYAKFVKTEETVNGVTYTFSQNDTGYSYYYNKTLYTIDIDSVKANGGYYAVTAYDGSYTGEWLVLESVINGYDVVAIGGEVFSTDSHTFTNMPANIVVPETVEFVWARAFYCNTSIQNIVFLADTVYFSNDTTATADGTDTGYNRYAFNSCNSTLNVYLNEWYGLGETSQYCNEIALSISRSGNSITGYNYTYVSYNTTSWTYYSDISVTSPDGLEYETEDIESIVVDILDDYSYNTALNAVNGAYFYTRSLDIQAAIEEAVLAKINAYTAEAEHGSCINGYSVSVTIKNHVITVKVTETDNAYYAVTVGNTLYDADSGNYAEWPLTVSETAGYDGYAVITYTNGESTVKVTYTGAVQIYDGTLYAAAGDVTITASSADYTFEGSTYASYAAVLNWKVIEKSEYTINVYSDVSFTLGGTPVTAATVTNIDLGAAETTLDSLAVTEPANYYFLGWAYDNAGTLTFASSIGYSTEITYYAIWGYNANVTLTNYSATSGDNALPAPAVSSGEFYNWYTDDSFTSGTVSTLQSGVYTYYARMQFTLTVNGTVTTSVYASTITINGSTQSTYSVAVLEGEQIYIYESETSKVYYIYQYVDGTNDTQLVGEMRIKTKSSFISSNTTQSVTISVDGTAQSSFGTDNLLTITSDMTVLMNY